MEPAFQENNVPIIMCASDYYAPYTSVVVQSILKCCSLDSNYDLIILTKDMTLLNRETMSQMVKNHENVSLRFVDMAEHIQSLYPLYYAAHFTIESYFRVFIPYILTGYEKVIYCDSDLVWLQDPAELYRTDLRINMFAAIIDPIYIYNQNYCGPFWENYNTHVLGIDAGTPYVNTGVMVWNLAMFRENFSLPYILQIAVDRDSPFLFCDQDILNILCEDAIDFLHPAWNVLADSIGRGKQLNQLLKQLDMDRTYADGRMHPKVWHWCDQKKPWSTEIIDHGYLFWEFARESPFCESILYRLAHDRYQYSAASRKLATVLDGRV